MKAISKFKGLLAKNRLAGDEKRRSMASIAFSLHSAPQSPDPARKAANAEAALALIQARRERSVREGQAGGGLGIFEVLGASGSGSGSTTTTTTGGGGGLGGCVPGDGSNRNSSDVGAEARAALPMLGIGTGGRDDFATGGGAADDDDAAAGVVSDSPSVVDYNVYDVAYVAELARIRAAAAAANERAATTTAQQGQVGGGADEAGGGEGGQASKAAGGSSGSSGGGGGGGGLVRRPTVYLNRMVKERATLLAAAARDDAIIIQGSLSGAATPAGQRSPALGPTDAAASPVGPTAAVAAATTTTALDDADVVAVPSLAEGGAGPTAAAAAAKLAVGSGGSFAEVVAKALMAAKPGSA